MIRKKPALGLDPRVEIRFSERIMLKQKARAGCRSNYSSYRSSSHQPRYAWLARIRSTSASAASLADASISDARKPLRTIATISSRLSDKASETAR